MYHSNTIPPEAKATRIVNGAISDIFDWPWQVGLRDNRQTSMTLFCGGSILNSNFVLTVAHCTEHLGSFPPESIVVTVGHLKKDLTEAEKEVYYQRRYITKIIGTFAVFIFSLYKPNLHRGLSLSHTV